MEGGRPLKFKTVKNLEDAIEAYFNSCWKDEYETDSKGHVIVGTDGALMSHKVQIKPYTIGGLAVALKTNRQTLLNYAKRDAYFDTISRARAAIEAYAEESLFTPKISSGVIFNLTNNFGWRNAQHTTHDVDGTLAELMRMADDKPPRGRAKN